MGYARRPERARLPGNVPLTQYSFTTKYLTRLAIGTERGAL